MKKCQLRWIKGRERYYTASLQKDLFGDWLLTCAWGSQKSRLGNMKNQSFNNHKEALEFISELTKKRASRGYLITTR